MGFSKHRFLENGFTLLSVFLFSFCVLSEDVGMQITHTTRVDVRTDNQNNDPVDDYYAALIDRLNLKLSYGQTRVDFRLDGNGFYFIPDHQPTNGRNVYRSTIAAERFQISHRFQKAQLDIGDIYQQVGRGFALSLRKFDEAGVDMAIRGARYRYDASKVKINFFGGRLNPVNIDPIGQRWVRNPWDWIAGTEWNLKLQSTADLGFYGVLIKPEESLDGIHQDNNLNFGITLNVPRLTSWLSLYTEHASQLRYETGVTFLGSANYLALTISPGAFAWIVESMLLRDWQVQGSTNSALGTRFILNQAPTLARIDQEIPSIRDVAGVRSKLSYTWAGHDLNLYQDTLFRRNEYHRDGGKQEIHAYAGFRKGYQHGASRFELQLGYRDERFIGSGQFFRTIAHFDIDWVHMLSNQVALHVTSNTQFRRFQNSAPLFGQTLAGLDRHGWGGVTMELGYDTQALAPGIRRVYLAGIFFAELSRNFTLKGTIGSQRGGLKCVAGVCRIFPSFSGAQVILISRF